MDITRGELESRLPEIEEAIRNCCFVAIDCEFTGLVLPRTFHPLDTTSERYSKLREGISNYVVLQLGLSFWDYKDEAGSYAVKTYNFYTFPDGADQETFWSEASSIRFLVQHGFDLNRCVRDGLPFMHPADFEKRQTTLKNRQISELKAILPECYASQVENVLDGTLALDEVLKAAQPRNIIHLTEAAAEDYILKHWNAITGWMRGTKNELVLPACNELVRVAFYKHMERVFFNGSFEMEAVKPDHKEEAQQGLKKIRLVRSETCPLERLIQRQKKSTGKLKERLGISSVLSCLSKSRKPVILHNSIRDLLHIVSQFFAPLPEAYDEFQSLCKEIFPTLFDTKFMVSFGVLKQYFRASNLSDLYNQIKNQSKTFPMPPVLVPDGYGYDDGTRDHEAGYDAWITGYIFAALAQFILPNKKNCFCKLDASHTNILPFKNKIPFPSSLDISCLDLDIQEDTLRRNNVFVIEWTENEALDYARTLVARAGGYKRIGYGDRVLAFVPNNVSECKKIMESHGNDSPPNCRFYNYKVPGQQPTSPQHKAVSGKAKSNRRHNSNAEPKSPPRVSPLSQNVEDVAKGPAYQLRLRDTTGTTARGSDLYHWTAKDGAQAACPDTKKRRVEGGEAVVKSAAKSNCGQGESPFPQADW